MSGGHDHDHDYDHGHPHEPVGHDGEPPAAARVRALEELLVEKGVVTREAVRQGIDWLVSRSPADGARLVAHAWVDPEFKQRLLADARAAADELGLEAGPSPKVVAVENTGEVHHMVVCTLCSCYPRALLGPPPAWYKSLAYRSRAVSEPRAVLSEFGEHPGFEERFHQRAYPLIFDPRPEAVHQSRMRDFIETGFDVALQHPLVIAGPGGEEVDLGDRVLRAPVRAEPVRARLEIRLENGLEHQFQACLDHAVGDSGNTEFPEFPVRFRYHHLAYLNRPEPA